MATDFTIIQSKRDGFQARYEDPENKGRFHRVQLWTKDDKTPPSKRTKLAARRRAPEAIQRHLERTRLERAVESATGGKVGTVSELFRYAKADPGAKGKLASDSVRMRDRTLDMFQLYLAKVLKITGPMPVTKITRGVIERWKNDRAAGEVPTLSGQPCRPCGHQTVSRELKIIKRAFNFCLQSAVLVGLESSPAQWVTVPGESDTAKAERIRDKSIPLEVCTEILEWTKTYQASEQCKTDGSGNHAPAWMYPYLVTLAHTGMRPGEARSLKWSKWKPQGANQIAVVKGKNGKRPVVLNPTVQAALAEWRELLKSWGIRSESVFVTWEGKPLTRDVARRAFSRVQKRMGLEQTFTYYGFRHAFAHALIKKAPINVVKAAMGHSSIRTTDVYLDLDVEDVADQIADALS